MKTARCYKCNLAIRVRSKIPKACPFCGYDKSEEDRKKNEAAL